MKQSVKFLKSPPPLPLLGRQLNEYEGVIIGRNMLELYPSDHNLILSVDVCVKAEEEDRFFVELCDLNMEFTHVIIS